MAANLLLLIGTVLLAIAQVFLLCFAGYILSRMDILNKQTRKQINRLNTSIFTPALIFAKVAFSLTSSQLKELWIIPLLFIIITAVSAGVAYLMGMLLRVKPAHRYFAMSAAMFMNSNSMPIALMSSLISTVSELKWNENDSKSDMLGRSLTYLVLFSTLGNIARWSFGVKILEKADDGTPDKLQGSKNADLESQQLAIGTAPGGLTTFSHSRSSSDGTVAEISEQQSSFNDNDRRRFYISDEREQSAENLPDTTNRALEPANPQVPLSTKSSSVTLATSSRTMTIQVPPEPDMKTIPPSRLQRLRAALRRFWIVFCDFMTAPLWAALLAIFIALIPPVQDLISNHMPPVRNALEMAGDCSIPLTLVVLGAYFYTPPPEGTVVPPLKERLRNAVRFRRTEGASMKEKNMRPGEKRTIFIALISRQVICPLLVLPIMLLFIRFNVPNVFADPVFVVSNVLLVSAPVALTLAQMSTKTGASDTFERLLSTTIFYAYCIVLTPVTILYVVIGLLLAKM